MAAQFLNRLLPATLAIAAVCGAAQSEAALLDYWRFNESSGSTADDAGTNNLDLTLTNGPTFVAGQLGNALSLDGVNDYAFNAGAPFTSDQNHTLSFWANVPSIPSGTTRVAIAWGVNGARYLFQLDDTAGVSDNDGRWAVAIGAGAFSKFTNAAALPTINTWQQWTLARSGTNASLYRNGSLVQTLTIANGGGITENGSADVNIGKQRTDQGNVQFFLGRLDDMAIWNRAISGAEATALHSFNTTSGLLYDAGLVDQLLTIYQNQTGTLTVGGLTWQYTTGLGGSLGQVTPAGPNYTVRLDNLNRGLTAVPVPEPGTFAMLLFGAIGVWLMRKPR